MEMDLAESGLYESERRGDFKQILPAPPPTPPFSEISLKFFSAEHWLALPNTATLAAWKFIEPLHW
jgi:hypothetical protein